MEYALNKVGVKALVMAEAFKTQRYYELLSSICPELDKSELGRLHSQR